MPCDTIRNLDIATLRSFVTVAELWRRDTRRRAAEPHPVGRVDAVETAGNCA